MSSLCFAGYFSDKEKIDLLTTFETQVKNSETTTLDLVDSLEHLLIGAPDTIQDALKSVSRYRKEDYKIIVASFLAKAEEKDIKERFIRYAVASENVLDVFNLLVNCDLHTDDRIFFKKGTDFILELRGEDFLKRVLDCGNLHAC